MEIMYGVNGASGVNGANAACFSSPNSRCLRTGQSGSRVYERPGAIDISIVKRLAGSSSYSTDKAELRGSSGKNCIDVFANYQSMDTMLSKSSQ